MLCITCQFTIKTGMYAIILIQAIFLLQTDFITKCFLHQLNQKHHDVAGRHQRIFDIT